MPAPIDFYFDFLSPYGYLGSVGIEKVAAKHGRQVAWRPMLLGINALKVMGIKPLNETPLKAPYLRRDVPRTARYMDIPIVMHDTTLAPLPAARAFAWLADDDPALAKRFGQAIYRAHWAEGRNMSTPAAVAAEAATLGIDADALLAAIETDRVKNRLKERVQESIEVGVFGTPTFVVDGEMFWGSDRLPMVDRWLETGGF